MRDQRLFVLGVQQQSLREGGRLAHFIGRGHASVEVGGSDGLAHTEVARRNTRTPEGTRKDPFSGPYAEAANRGDTIDYLVVGQRRQRLNTQFAGRDRARGIDYVFRLAVGELERADVGDCESGETLGVEAIDDLARDAMWPAEGFGQAAADGGCPLEVHLLSADTADERAEEIGLHDGTEATMTLVEPCDHRIGPA